MGHKNLPEPPEGFEYKLVPVKPKKTHMKDMDPKDLTKRQLCNLEYRERNRERLLANRRLRYQKQKQINLSKEETSETTKSE